MMLSSSLRATEGSAAIFGGARTYLDSDCFVAALLAMAASVTGKRRVTFSTAPPSPIPGNSPHASKRGKEFLARGAEPGNRGQPPIYAHSFTFLGRPTDRARTRRPMASSTLLRNRSLPSGRPVCVWRRRRLASSASSGSRSISRQFNPSDSSLHLSIRINPVGSEPPQCAAALDHAYSHAARTIFARTGFRSTYRSALHRCASSSAHE